MCLAVPVRVAAICQDSKVSVQMGESGGMDVSTLLLPSPPKIGDYVIVHAGFALRILDEQEAEESLKIFRQLAELEPASSAV